MNLLRKLLAAVLINAVVAGAALANGTKEEALAMLDKAIASAQQNGVEKTLKAISDPDNKTFHDRDLYIYAYDLNGNCIGHGTNPKLIGKNLADMKDAAGKLWYPEMVAVVKAKGAGSIEFMWNNPETKKIQPKVAFVKKIPGFDGFLGTGIYK